MNLIVVILMNQNNLDIKVKILGMVTNVRRSVLNLSHVNLKITIPLDS